MDTLNELLLEAHNKAQTERIIQWVGVDEGRFDALVERVCGSDAQLAQRGAWPMSYIASAHPQLATKHLPMLLQTLHRSSIHNAIVRNALRFMQHVQIPESLQGEVMDTCFGYIENPREKSAIKAFSLTILYNLSKQYPEILPEIKSIISARMEYEKPAFKARAKIFRTS